VLINKALWNAVSIRLVERKSVCVNNYAKFVTTKILTANFYVEIFTFGQASPTDNAAWRSDYEKKSVMRFFCGVCARLEIERKTVSAKNFFSLGKVMIFFMTR
jgi:hypothetical protein